MGWSIGYDSNWQRDIGYGVPATCDHPECGAEIDRGLSHVCGGNPYGEPDGCGLFFCGDHLFPILCDECTHGREAFEPTPDIRMWIQHKLTDDSWAEWRTENPEWVEKAKLEGSA